MPKMKNRGNVDIGIATQQEVVRMNTMLIVTKCAFINPDEFNRFFHDPRVRVVITRYNKMLKLKVEIKLRPTPAPTDRYSSQYNVMCVSNPLCTDEQHIAKSAKKKRDTFLGYALVRNSC